MKFVFKGKIEKEIFPHGILKPGMEFDEERPEQIEALMKVHGVEVVKDKPKKVIKKTKGE